MYKSHLTNLKKIFFLLLLALALVIPVSAVKPISQVTTAYEGFQISYPDFNIGKVSTPIEIDLHVYSLSTGLVVNNNVNCTLHLYNSTGNHIFAKSTTTTSHEFDYEILINESILTVPGEYGFQAYCRNSTRGGFVRQTFIVSNDGRSTNNNYFSFSMIIAIAIFSFICLYIGKNVDEEHILLKLFLYIVTVILGFSGVAMSLAIINTDLVSLTLINSATTIYKVVAWTLVLFSGYLVIYYMYRLLKWLGEAIKR